MKQRSVVKGASDKPRRLDLSFGFTHEKDESKLKSRRPTNRYILALLVALCLASYGLSIQGAQLRRKIAMRARSHEAQAAAGTTPRWWLKSYETLLKCKKDEEEMGQMDPSCGRFPKGKDLLPHDFPNHPWHWSRANGPDPSLSLRTDCKGDSYEAMYNAFHHEGYVIFESCTLGKKLVEDAAKYTGTITQPRVQDAKEQSVKDISADPDTLEFLEFLHGGRRVFPFQTLNFPIGTQQPLHSDLIHFDTFPRTLMSAAWLALEDMTMDNGPLRYVPRSHLLGTNDFEEIELRDKYKDQAGSDDYDKLHKLYGLELESQLTKAGLKVQLGNNIKKGQSFVWAAGLAHGGSKRNDMTLSRLSQVTHYYFEGAKYYWVPRESSLDEEYMMYKDYPPQCTTPISAPREDSCSQQHIRQWLGFEL